MAKPKHLTLLVIMTLTALAVSACNAQIDITPTATSTSGAAHTSTPQTPQTAQPTEPAASGLTPTELKYLLLDKYANAHNLLYCDPDMFPVGVSPEEELKRGEAKLPEIQNNKEEYQAILRHNNLSQTTDLSDDQKLLIYRDSKKLNTVTLEPADDKYKFAIKVGKAPNENEGDGTKIEGLIDNTGSITSEKREDVQVMCPICLAGDTRIDTPNGPIQVKDLRQGMPVWTLDSHGVRRAATILKTVKRTVQSPHEMIHIVLSDGRELVASPRHPITDGQLIGNLTVGDTLDNARIVKAERIPYNEDATYDILPSGDTAFYWANGILIASTLAPAPPPLDLPLRTTQSLPLACQGGRVR
jgi:hypothetical protein